MTLSDILRLKSVLETTSEYNVSELLGRKEYGPLDFTQLKQPIEQVTSLSRDLLALNLTLLPQAKVTELLSTATHLDNQINQLYGFNVMVSDARQRRNDLSQAVWAGCDAFSVAVMSVLPFLVLKEPRTQEIFQQTNETIDSMHLQINEATQNLEKRVGEKIGEVDTALEVIRTTAAQTGVTRHADSFKTAAAEHEAASKQWLMAAAVLVGCTFIAALSLLHFFPPTGEIKEASTIQRIFSKLVMISILYYSAIWSAKNYRAHRHLSVVNRHRQNALQTFESFVEGAKGDEGTKNAVLLEATRCIFTPANTGYLGTDEENPSGRVVEILKTFSSSTGK